MHDHKGGCHSDHEGQIQVPPVPEQGALGLAQVHRGRPCLHEVDTPNRIRIDFKLGDSSITASMDPRLSLNAGRIDLG